MYNNYVPTQWRAQLFSMGGDELYFTSNLAKCVIHRPQYSVCLAI